MIDTTEQSSRSQRHLELVVQTGLLLARTLDLQTLVQAAADAGLELSGAQFGAFFYNIVDQSGETCLLYALSGVDRERFARFSMPRNTGLLAPTFQGDEIVRSGDITKDPRYGHNVPHHGMPKGHLPVRSYLAIPVKNQSGEVFGGLFYGHEETDIFGQEAEDLVATIAAHAAIAIENFRLREQLTRRIEEAKKNELFQRKAARRAGEIAAIVESSDDAIVSKDLNGFITSWNQSAARILGYPHEEALGSSIFMLIPEELHEEERSILAKVRAGEHIDHFETIRVTKDGRKLNVSLSISPVRDESGTIVGASKILRDISDRKRIEASLLQSEKIAAAGRMAATIAHEVNNPLEAVTNLIYLAKNHTEDPVQVAAWLDAAESEVMRVSHIAKQTLGFYRENASAVEASLSELAANAIRIYESKCKAAGISIKEDLRSTHRVVLRKGEILQVISNLIANAIYAMPAGGTLTISVEDADTPAGSGVVLRIKDTGVGIPAQQLPKIFDAFFTTRTAIGTGIGLFVAKQFIEGHSGRIEVESSTDPIHHGTTMSVFLPLKNAHSVTP